MAVVARRGFDATVAEIAQLSGVSPRTIFRHYASHDRLIVATVKDMYEAWGRRPIEGLPTPTDDFDGWLTGLAITIHTRSAQIIGEAFWDLHTPSNHDSECSMRSTRSATSTESVGSTISWDWHGAPREASATRRRRSH